MMDVATIGLIEDEDILLDLASLALSHLDQKVQISPPISKGPKRSRTGCAMKG
jgi:hypothetical protein